MAEGRKFWIIVFLLAFTIRLIVAIVYLNFDTHALTLQRKPFLLFGSYSRNVWGVVGNRDGYNLLAHNLIASGEISYVPGRFTRVPPPLYPIFLAICYAFFGFNVFAFFIPHIILDSISSTLVFFLGQRIFNYRTGIIASLLYALSPHFILSCLQLYSETLHFFLILLVFLFCHKLLSNSYKKYAVGIGIFMALAALCRSVFLVFIPFIFIWLVVMLYQQRLKMFTLILVIFLSFSLVYGVWVVRNYRVFTRVLFSEFSRAASWYTDWPSNASDFTKYLNIYEERGVAFINWVKENPKQYFNLCVNRLKIFLLAPCVKGVSFRHRAVSSLIFFTIYPLGYLGIAKAVKERNKVVLLILLFICSATIFHVLVSLDGELRYRLPVELFMTIFAAYGLKVIIERLEAEKLYSK